MTEKKTFVASDGKEFATKIDCLFYEDSFNFCNYVGNLIMVDEDLHLIRDLGQMKNLKYLKCLNRYGVELYKAFARRNSYPCPKFELMKNPTDAIFEYYKPTNEFIIFNKGDIE